MTNTEEEISKRIRKNIKAYRKNAQLTQFELAMRADFGVDFICSLEQGKRTPSVSTLCRLADALGVDPCEFLKP